MRQNVADDLMGDIHKSMIINNLVTRYRQQCTVVDSYLSKSKNPLLHIKV